MRKIIILSLVFSFFFVTKTFAQVTIKSEVDKTVITANEVITYKLIITSAQKSIPAPKLPEFKGFKIISSAQSSAASFAAGKTKAVLVYTFILSPTATGKFKIEPSTIKIKNQDLSTDAFEIEVKQKPPLTPDLPPEETEESQKITL